MDTLMVSWLGNTQMAAVTTANVPVFLLISIVFGVQSGLSILVSQYWGKRDMEHISRAIGVAAMLGTGLTVVLAAVLYLWPVEIMDLLSNNHEPVGAGCAVSEAHRHLLCVQYALVPVCQRPAQRRGRRLRHEAVRHVHGAEHRG